jgi:hypothetical protein
MKIGELIGKIGKVLTPWGEAKFYAVRSKGIQEVYRWKFSDGRYLDATKDHKIFTAQREWKKLGSITIEDMIPLPYDNRGSIPYKATVQRQELLPSRWQDLLSALNKRGNHASTPGGIGVPQWRDPYESIPHPPQGWQSGEQPDRESRDYDGGGAPRSPQQRASNQQRVVREKAGTHRQDKADDKRMAQVIRGQGVAQEACSELPSKDMGSSERNKNAKRQDSYLRGVWKHVLMRSPYKGEVLRPTLHKQVLREKVQGARLTKIEHLGKQEVFDLSVEGLHCMVANGVIVSNCSLGWMTLSDSKAFSFTVGSALDDPTMIMQAMGGTKLKMNPAMTAGDLNRLLQDSLKAVDKKGLRQW